MGVLCESEVIAVCRPKSQLLYSYENSFWFADRELFSCSFFIVSDEPEIARTFFRSLPIGHTRLRFIVSKSVNTFHTLFMYFLTLAPILFFFKTPYLCGFSQKKNGVYKKVLTNHQHFTINTNYKHKVRSNDRIFSFLLGFMVIFSRRCTVSLSLKNTSKIIYAAFFSAAQYVIVCYNILCRVFIFLHFGLLTSLSFYFRFFYYKPILLPLKFKNGF